MDFEAEAAKLHNSLSTPWKNAVDEIAGALTRFFQTRESDGAIATALRRAYEAGAADALVKHIDAAAGDAWVAVSQEGE